MRRCWLSSVAWPTSRTGYFLEIGKESLEYKVCLNQRASSQPRLVASRERNLERNWPMDLQSHWLLIAGPCEKSGASLGSGRGGVGRVPAFNCVTPCQSRRGAARRAEQRGPAVNCLWLHVLHRCLHLSTTTTTTPPTFSPQATKRPRRPRRVKRPWQAPFCNFNAAPESPPANTISMSTTRTPRFCT